MSGYRTKVVWPFKVRTSVSDKNQSRYTDRIFWRYYFKKGKHRVYDFLRRKKYSVPPKYIGKKVDITDTGSGFDVSFNGHFIRHWEKSGTVSHFPYIKTVKDFDFFYQPTINKEQIMDFLVFGLLSKSPTSFLSAPAE